MKKAPTIYDVSRLAGVSTTTISRVLNKPDLVNPETREIVKAAIKELGYRPLVEARLRNNTGAKRICVLAPRFTDNSFVHRLRGVTTALGGDPGYELQVFSVDSKLQLDRFINSLPIRGLDGLILLSIPVDEEQIEKILVHDVQVTFVEYETALANCVVIDDERGGYLAGEHLLSTGHQKFGVVGEWTTFDYSVFPNDKRRDGYVRALDEAGFSLDPRFVYDVPCNVNAAYEMFCDVFRSSKNRAEIPDAIFALSDVQAIGICRAAHESGIRIPEDLAVIGFDDIEFAEYFGLTTIRQHLDQSGKLAVDLLKGRFKDRSRVLQKVNLPVEVVIRQTA